jgi:hypothetical protein
MRECDHMDKEPKTIINTEGEPITEEEYREYLIELKQLFTQLEAAQREALAVDIIAGITERIEDVKKYIQDFENMFPDKATSEVVDENNQSELDLMQKENRDVMDEGRFEQGPNGPAYLRRQ